MNDLTLFVGVELPFKFEMSCRKPFNEWQTIWNEMNLLRVKGMRKSIVWITCNRINSDWLIRKCSQILNELP